MPNGTHKGVTHASRGHIRIDNGHEYELIIGGSFSEKPRARTFSFFRHWWHAKMKLQNDADDDDTRPL